MKITEKIENYDSLTPEEKIKALEDLEINDSNDEVAKLKQALNKASSEAANYKKELREKQTEQERLEAERKEEVEKKDELLKSLMKEKSVAEYQAKFLKQGYNEELAMKSAIALADGDFNSVFEGMSSFLAERESAIKENLLNSTPAPRGGHAALEVTKEQFDSMSIKERTELYESDKDLYEKLKGE